MQIVIVTRSAVPYEATPEGEAGAWDGAAAARRLRDWAGVDAPEAPAAAWQKYARGFAWVDAANAETLVAYKLPHHDVEGGRLVLSAAGLAAAAGALGGARGGVDIPESELPAVRRHLEQHYAALGKRAPWDTARERVAKVICADPKRRKIYLAVMVPDQADSYGDTATREEVEKAQDQFMVDRAEVIVGHRVHPDGWPDGVDAEIGMSPIGTGVEIKSVHFDRRRWNEREARAWAAKNAPGKRMVMDDGPVNPELVESAIAPVTLTRMHGVDLPEPLPEGSWYIAARLPEGDDPSNYTGASIGATVGS